MFMFYSQDEATHQFELLDTIKEKYLQAVLLDDWNDYDYVYGLYCEYKRSGGKAAYIDTLLKDYGRHYAKTLYEAQNAEDNIGTLNKRSDTELVENSELNYENINVKPKTFENMSYKQKIKAVNKEIEDLLASIERGKQAKYRKYKELYNGL